MKLSDRLSLYVLSVCLAIGLGLTVVLEITVSRSQRQQAERVISLFQQQLTGQFRRDLADVERQVRRSALEIELSNPANLQRNAAMLLRVMIESDSLIMGGSVALDPQAEPKPGEEWMLYASLDSAGFFSQKILKSPEYPYTQMSWYKRPIELRRGCWSEVYMDEGAGETTMVTYSTPLFDRNDSIYAVVTADISLARLGKMVSELRPYKDSKSYLVDTHGHIVDSDYFSGEGDHSHLARLQYDDRKDIVTTTPLEGLSMSVTTVTPMSSLMGLLRALRVHFIVIMLFAITLLVIIIHMVIRRTTSPLRRLSEAALSIGEGNFSTPLPSVKEFSELTSLRDAMATMMESIKTHVKKIAEDARHMERIENELAIARRIQLGMLPAASPEIAGMQPAAVLQPAREVSGDLYDYVIDGDRLIFTIADVSGKGVPASLVMSQIKNLFHFNASQGASPAELLANLNKSLCDNNPHNMFVTMLIGVADTRRQSLTLSNAGHNPPMVAAAGEARFERLDAGLPLGIMDDVEYTETEIRFAPGDMIFLYTDGLTEALDEAGEEYGEERLLKVAQRVAADAESDADTMESAVKGDIDRFAVKPLADDITLLTVEMRRPKEMDTEIVKEFTYEITQIDALSEFLQSIWAERGWNPEDLARVNLVAEEALANVINYSHPQDATERISLALKPLADGLMLTLTDAGQEFNPLQEAPEADITSGAEERPVGGLGIYLIRQYAEALEYERLDNHNILRIKIKLH